MAVAALAHDVEKRLWAIVGRRGTHGGLGLDAVIAEIDERLKNEADVDPAVKRSSQYQQGRAAGAKWAIAWLHDRALQMGDPRARAVLNVAADDLGHERLRAFKPLKED